MTLGGDWRYWLLVHVAKLLIRIYRTANDELWRVDADADARGGFNDYGDTLKRDHDDDSESRNTRLTDACSHKTATSRGIDLDTDIDIATDFVISTCLIDDHYPHPRFIPVDYNIYSH